MKFVTPRSSILLDFTVHQLEQVFTAFSNNAVYFILTNTALRDLYQLQKHSTYLLPHSLHGAGYSLQKLILTQLLK